MTHEAKAILSVLRSHAERGLITSSDVEVVEWVLEVNERLVEAAENALSEHEARFGPCCCGICSPLRAALEMAGVKP